MEDQFVVIRGIAKFVVTRSVSGVIVTALHNNNPIISRSQEIQVYIGAYVVGAMVADKAVDYVDQKIVSTCVFMKEFKDNRKKNQTK